MIKIYCKAESPIKPALINIQNIEPIEPNQSISVSMTPRPAEVPFIHPLPIQSPSRPKSEG